MLKCLNNVNTWKKLKHFTVICSRLLAHCFPEQSKFTIGKAAKLCQRSPVWGWWVDKAHFCLVTVILRWYTELLIPERLVSDAVFVAVSGCYWNRSCYSHVWSCWQLLTMIVWGIKKHFYAYFLMLEPWLNSRKVSRVSMSFYPQSQCQVHMYESQCVCVCYFLFYFCFPCLVSYDSVQLCSHVSPLPLITPLSKYCLRPPLFSLMVQSVCPFLSRLGFIFCLLLYFF